MEAPVQQRYSFGPFLLDPTEKVLLRKGHAVVLAPKALETLLALVEHRGHVMQKSELLERVWPNTFVEEATLTQNIFTLRKALDDSPDGHEYIETVPKRGYRFVASVKTTEEQEVRTHTHERPMTFLGSFRQRLLWAVAGFLVVIVSVGIYFRGRSPAHTPAPAGRVMLAVLPFENLSGDSKQQYFSDGLTEEMIAQLSRFDPEQLRVIARTSAMQYRGTTKSAAQIGRELGVDYLLESSFRREGKRIRITTQLVRVSDQTHLWAQSYEREAQGLLALEKDVANDVATQIALKLNPAAKRPAGIPNLNAYEAYLKGRFFWNKRSEEGHLKAIEYFEQAISEDPGYAQAYSGLADAYALLGSNPTAAFTRQEAMARARAAALKALAIDDKLADAHASLAFVYWHYDWNWAAAEKEFQLALQLNPSYPTAHHWYAYYLLSQDRTEQALEEVRRAQETDPLSLVINTDVGEVLFYAQHYSEAIEQAKRVLEMDPGFGLAHRVLTWSYLKEQQYGAAVQEAEKGIKMSGAKSDLELTLAATYAATGQEAKARELLLQVKAESERLHTGQLFLPIAQVCAALGQKDQAFSWLEKDLQDHDGALTLINVMPFFDALHGDPRFAGLVHRIGLHP